MVCGQHTLHTNARILITAAAAVAAAECSVRIEWIIIWLIAVELVVGCVELLGLFGLVGREK